MADIKVDIDSETFIKLTEKVCDDAAEKGAVKVMRDSKIFLGSKAKGGHGSDGLAGEIKLVKSKYKGGGVAIEAQGPGNYKRFYATFVELGHHSSVFGKYKNKTGPAIAPIPYLRNPLKANKQYIINLFKDLI